MILYLCLAATLVAAVASLYFSTLTYALRDFSHAKLAEYLGRRNGDRWFDPLTEHAEQYMWATAICRLIANLLIWLGLLGALESAGAGPALRYGGSLSVAAVVGAICSIAIPQALAKYAAEPAIGFAAPLLAAIGAVLSPLTRLMSVVDEAARRALGIKTEVESEEIEREIMSVVEEGEKEGVVDEQERKLIENVIEFRDATAGHIMRPRTEIVALEIGADAETARQAIENCGHSRLPVYEQTLDRVVGILHARDLLKWLGAPARPLDMRAALRPAMFVPETKPLRNLLNDFRQQQVHMAIVLDEYGSTAGLVTIEDVLEELVGEIGDEHEPRESGLFHRSGEAAAEADARLPVSELNQQMGLELPENAGYETLGGFLMSSLNRIPEKGAVYEFNGARFTVTDAEPRKINRVRIELLRKNKPPGEMEAGAGGREKGVGQKPSAMG
jgi:magnesium and cobalt exporter, CNNM family